MGAEGEVAEPEIAFRVLEGEKPALEVRVNFGMFTGRHATPAEIDDLARSLHDDIDSFTIVAEERHEFAGAVEASLHQVVIEIGRDYDGDPDKLCQRIVATAHSWAEACIASRHTEI